MKKIIVLFLMSTITACSVDSRDTVNGHDQAKTNSLSDFTKSLNLDITLAKWNEIDWQELQANEVSGDSEKLKKNVEILKQFFLNSKLLINFDFWSQIQFSKGLKIFNSSLIGLLKSDKETGYANKIIDSLMELVLESCLPATLDKCKLLDIFKSDSRMGFFAKMIAERISNVRKKYFYYKLAIVLGGRQNDKNLDEAIFANSLALIQTYVKSSGQENKVQLSIKHLSDNEKKELKTYLLIVSRVLSASNSFTKKSKYQNMLIEYFNWAESGQIEKVLGRKFLLTLTQFLTVFLNKEFIAQPFKQAIVQIEKRSPESYTNVYKKVQKLAPNLLKLMNLNEFKVDALKPGSVDLVYFYIVRRLFFLEPGQFHIEIWEANRTKPIKMLKVMNQFLLVQMLHTALEANVSLAKFTNGELKSGVEREEIFDKTVKYAKNNVAQLWADFVRGSRNVENFYEGQFGGLLLDNIKDEEYVLQNRQVAKLFEGRDVNIKLISTYPHLMVLAYQTIVGDFSKQIGHGKDTITINKDNYVNFLFNGDLPPLLQYQSSNTPLNAVQMMWSLAYAVQMDLPKLFNIDTNLFFKKIFDTQLKKRTEELKDWIDRLEASRKSGSSFQNLMEFCDQYTASSNSSTLNYPRQNVDFIKFLNNMTLFGNLIINNVSSIEPLKGAFEVLGTFEPAKVGGYKYAADEAIELLRSDIDPVLRQLFLVRKIFSNSGRNDVKFIDDILTQFDSHRSRLVALIEEAEIQFADCWLIAIEQERDRQKQIVDMNINFASTIYDFLVALKELGEFHPSTVSVEVIAQDSNHQLFSDFPELLTNKRYSKRSLIDALNLWVTDQTHLSKYFLVNPSYRDDYVKSAGFRQSESGTFIWHEREYDLYIRLIYFAKYGFRLSQLKFKNFNFDVAIPKTTAGISTRLKIGTSISQETSEISIRRKKLEGWTSKQLLISDFLHFSDKLLKFLEHELEVTYVRDFLKIRMANYRYIFENEVNVEEIQKCERDLNCIQETRNFARTKAKNIGHWILRLFDHFNLNESENKYLDFMRISNLFNASDATKFPGPNFLFVSTARERYLPLFQDAFTYLLSRRLGYGASFRSLADFVGQTTYRETATKRHSLLIKRNKEKKIPLVRRDSFWRAQYENLSLRKVNESLIFPLGDGVQEIIHTNFTFGVKRHARAMSVFLEIADTFADSNNVSQYHFDTLWDPGQPGILPETGLRSQYHYDFTEFNKKTGYIYLPKELIGNPIWDKR